MVNEAVQEYIRAVGEDLRTNEGKNDRWEGEAHGAADALQFLASQGIIDMETSAVIKQAVVTSEHPEPPTPTQATAHTIQREAGTGTM